MLQSGRWTQGDVWARFRLLAEANQLEAAKRSLGFLPGEAPDAKEVVEG